MSLELVTEEPVAEVSEPIPTKVKAISEAQLIASRDQWAAQIQEVQQTIGKLQEELAQAHQQIAVLTGAVTACNLFLQNLQEFD